MDSIFEHESDKYQSVWSKQMNQSDIHDMFALPPAPQFVNIYWLTIKCISRPGAARAWDKTITHAPRAAPVVIRTAASVKQSGADITFDDWSKEIFITELQIQVKSSTAFWYHIRRQDQVTNRLYRKQIFGMLLPNSYFSESIKSNNNESCVEGIRPGGSCQNILSGPESCQLWLRAIVGLKALKGWPDHHNGAVTRLMPQI